MLNDPLDEPVELASLFSGSELDEVNKSLLAMAALRPSVRAALASEGLVASVIANLLRRSRFTSDLEVMTREGQVRSAMSTGGNGA